MTYEQIKKYLAILVDMEMNVYIQRETIQKLEDERAYLGIRTNFKEPRQRQARAEYKEEIFGAGLVVGLIIAVIVTFSSFGSMWNGKFGIFAIFTSPIWGVICGIGGGILGGLLIGPMRSVKKRKQWQRELDYEYFCEIEEYEKLKKNDDIRVKNELLRKTFISQQLGVLEERYANTKKNLKELYDYNIIHSDYKYDMVAICSFYQYFDKRRTLSLEFDVNTGDKGAYNIYEEDKRLGIIISKLDDVINKLDVIIENQRTIADTLYKANDTIGYLCGSVQEMSNRISSVKSSIEKQTAIEAYNSERIQSELGYMNTMNIIYNWH